ncbi:winged helix-turn-helix transcriptional regulator [Gymnodinialimonas hymeniacidonis]|uniref:winged helix-turn-helix transcriptional regulator n=1 Tax=Gymnodinialimonas hymeniacidonis TaxID=3126508 RepID=UPI0034C697AC
MTPDELAKACPADPVLRAIAGRWKTHVLYFLGENGPARFTMLQRRLAPVSPKVLSSRLKELAEDGMIWRKQEATIPPKVTYGLTDLGGEVHTVLKSFDPLGKKIESEAAKDPS